MFRKQTQCITGEVDGILQKNQLVNAHGKLQPTQYKECIKVMPHFTIQHTLIKSKCLRNIIIYEIQLLKSRGDLNSCSSSSNNVMYNLLNGEIPSLTSTPAKRRQDSYKTDALLLMFFFNMT